MLTLVIYDNGSSGHNFLGRQTESSTKIALSGKHMSMVARFFYGHVTLTISAIRNQSHDAQQARKESFLVPTSNPCLIHWTNNGSPQVPPSHHFQNRCKTYKLHNEFFTKKIKLPTINVANVTIHMVETLAQTLQTLHQY